MSRSGEEGTEEEETGTFVKHCVTERLRLGWGKVQGQKVLESGGTSYAEKHPLNP